MARKRFSSEQIIGMLTEAEVGLSQGKKVKSVSQSHSWDRGADLVPLAEGLRWDGGFVGQAS